MDARGIFVESVLILGWTVEFACWYHRWSCDHHVVVIKGERSCVVFV